MFHVSADKIGCKEGVLLLKYNVGSILLEIAAIFTQKRESELPQDRNVPSKLSNIDH